MLKTITPRQLKFCTIIPLHLKLYMFYRKTIAVPQQHRVCVYFMALLQHRVISSGFPIGTIAPSYPLLLLRIILTVMFLMIVSSPQILEDTNIQRVLENFTPKIPNTPLNCHRGQVEETLQIAAVTRMEELEVCISLRAILHVSSTHFNNNSGVMIRKID